MLASLPLTIRRDVDSRAAKGSAAQFIQDMTWVCMPRRAFRTVSGLIGLGPRILKNGDRCCVLLGSALPMILRRREDGHSDKYVLLGEANLHGFMNYEAMTLWLLGKLQIQELNTPLWIAPHPHPDTSTPRTGTYKPSFDQHIEPPPPCSLSINISAFNEQKKRIL